MEVLLPPNLAADVSGAPEFGGATTPGSTFGGRTFTAAMLRLMARFGRHLTSFAYRVLRELEREDEEEIHSDAGRPRRTQEARAPHGHHHVHLTHTEEPSF
jgi:hypothetical protein